MAEEEKENFILFDCMPFDTNIFNFPHDSSSYLVKGEKLALADMQALMDIGRECMEAGKPEQRKPQVLSHKIREGEKLLNSRDKELYAYVQEVLNTHQAVAFSEYYPQL